MKKKLLFTVLISALSLTYVKAQDDNSNKSSGKSGLALELGAGVNYYQGLPDRNFEKFESERLNWQLNGMLGITLTRDKADRRTLIAAFGTVGLNNRNTITQLLKDQQYLTLAADQAASNNFYQLEGGLVIADIIRISTGVGQQNFNSQLLASADGVQINATNLKYNSSTIGLKLNFRSIVWVINCNFAYGQDYNKTVIAPNTGLMLRF